HDPSTQNGTTMTRMTPLLDRNEQFAGAYTPVPLGLPTAQVLIVTCLDHRIDPAIVLGLQLGEAPVIRNAGGRVIPAVIDNIAYLAFLAEQLSGRQGPADTLFEVAVVHHTQCGTGFLDDPDFRRRAAEATGGPVSMSRPMRYAAGYRQSRSCAFWPRWAAAWPCREMGEMAGPSSAGCTVA